MINDIGEKSVFVFMSSRLKFFFSLHPAYLLNLNYFEEIIDHGNQGHSTSNPSYEIPLTSRY